MSIFSSPWMPCTTWATDCILCLCSWLPGSSPDFDQHRRGTLPGPVISWASVPSWTVCLSPSYDEILTLSTSKCDCSWSLPGGNEVAVRPLGISVRRGDRYAHRGKTMGRSGTKIRSLRARLQKKPALWTLDLKCVASSTVRKLMSIKPCSLWCCVTVTTANECSMQWTISWRNEQLYQRNTLMTMWWLTFSETWDSF